MKRKYGKIAIWTMLALFMAVLVATWTLPREAEGAIPQPTRTFVLPSTSEVTHSANTYLILWEKGSGNLVYSTTGADPNDAGTFAAGTTWANATIATAVHAQNGCVYTATIPKLNTSYDYCIAVFDAGSPAKTDVPTMGPFLYDPKRAAVFSDTNPLEGRSVRVIQDL